MLLNMDRDRNIETLGKKLSIFCRTHIAVGHRFQGGRPGPLRLPSGWLRIWVGRMVGCLGCVYELVGMLVALVVSMGWSDGWLPWL